MIVARSKDYGEDEIALGFAYLEAGRMRNNMLLISPTSILA